jgi:FkbM family methyltransferase
LACSIQAKFAKDEYVLHGIRMPIDRKIMTDVVIAALMNGSYEKPEAVALNKLLRADDRVFELGGGLGLISSMAAKCVTSGAVTTVEANADVLRYIKHVHALNGVQVNVLNAVVVGGMAMNALPFYVRKDFWASSLSPEPQDYVECRMVAAHGLRAQVQATRPTVVICDIEGGEIGLIDEDWTQGVRLVMMEVHKPQIGKLGIQKIVNFFTAAGFKADVKGAMLLASRD